MGNIIDMTDINRIAPDAVLYVWQGGMTGGKGTADVLTGKVSPSGKLPDTIASKALDYPSDANFGREKSRDIYAEDIYVGYRYFETFAKEKVLYPFGFGLSYTAFEIKTVKAEITEGAVKLSASVKNIGSYKGKEVIEVYCEAPQGKLGKAARVLCGFEKTRELVPQEEQVVEIAVDISKLASYDDSGVTGNKSCYVLEAGEYKFYVGSDVRSAEYACSFEQGENFVTERLTQALAPVESFERIKPVCEGGASSVMTTYGRVNGLWTAGNFDLNTVILREEWGFKGFTMTDWWANINVRGKEPDKTDLAAMARAQNDVYMVCPDGEKNDDNTLAALENGGIERCELQRNAANICGFLLHTNALKRAEGIGDTVKVINREDEEQEDDKPVQFYKVDRDITLDLSDVDTKKGTSYSFALDLSNFGIYRVIVTASSTQSELAQIPMTLFSMGTAVGTFTFNGTGGKAVSMEKKTPMFSRFTTFRIYFAQNGLDLHSIRFELTDEKR